MRNGSNFNYESNILKYHLFISFICGLTVQKFVQKKRINRASFTHFAQQEVLASNIQKLYSFIYPQYSQTLHNYCMQITSVSLQFYTLYTGPITTTTYNIFKKG